MAICGDGLAIGDLRGEELYVELVFVVELPLHYVDVLLSVSAQDGLAQLLEYSTTTVGSSEEIFLSASPSFCSSCWTLALMAQRYLGAGNLDLVPFQVGAGQRQRGVALSVLEFHGASEVSGMQGAHRLFLETGHGVDGRQAPLVACDRVFEVHSRGDGSAHDLEERNFSEMGLHVVFVDEQGCGACGGRSQVREPRSW